MKNLKSILAVFILALILFVGCQANPNPNEANAQPASPTVKADQNDKLGFVITTNKGVMKGELYPKVAPNTVLNFVKLTNAGFYNGLTFHRVVPGFVIQGGDPLGNGTGGPGYSIPAEFSKVKHQVGILSMARSQDPHSAGSQFFVCIGDDQVKHLDGQYAVFGKVTEGIDVALKIQPGDKMTKVVITGKLPKELQNRELKKSGSR